MNQNDFLKNFPSNVACLPSSALDLLLNENRPLRIKLGFDPTASDLHLGHSVLLNVLRKFQSLGHIIVVIIGDFTACIGDPTLRDVTRPPLGRVQVHEYAKDYAKQLFRFLDKEKTEIHYNSKWLDKIDLKQWIELMANVTVSQLIERDDFTKRLTNGLPVFGHEIIYPLLQGYDSVAIKADIEIGGTDQTFNLMMGRTLQKIYNQNQQVVMTFPIIEGLDGVRKMSKSYNNTIRIEDNPKDMYGKIMSISDELMWKYYKALTTLSLDEINNCISMHPLEAKHNLAKIIVGFYHDQNQASEQELLFRNQFSKGILPENLEVYKISNDMINLNLNVLLKQLGLIESSSMALRLLDQKAIKINDEIILKNAPIPKMDNCVVRLGKKKIFKLVWD